MESTALLLFVLFAAIVFVLLASWFHSRSARHEAGAEGVEEFEEEELDMPETVELEIEGSLDLHTFSPKDIGSLVPEWLAACRERGLTEVRIIHGKGKGVQRRQVHAILDRHPAVEDYSLAGPGRGDWGATIVTLSPAAPD